MKPFFQTNQRLNRLALLRAAAEELEGTPFRANSCVPGVGMSCQFAPAICLQRAGFTLPPIPHGPTAWARHQTHSIQEEWMDAHTELFLALDGRPPAIESLQPGDVVGFICGLCVHHLGIILPPHPERGAQFFQCLEATGAVILSQQEKQFRERLMRAWRPVEP